MATNQSDIARSYYDLAVFEAIHARLYELAVEQGGKVSLIVHCSHGPNDGYKCRRPKPDMLRQIGRHYGVDLSGIWFVDDNIGDLEVARAVDCRSVLVETGKSVRMLDKLLPEGALIFGDLAAAASALLQ